MDVQRFKNYHFDTFLINNDLNNMFLTRHKNENIQAYEINKVIFEKMIQLCVKNKVPPVILITPVYFTYYNAMLPEKKLRRDNFLTYCVNKYPEVKVLDFENGNDLPVTDFLNEDHLEPVGSKKFSHKIDSILNVFTSNRP